MFYLLNHVVFYEPNIPRNWASVTQVTSARSIFKSKIEPMIFSEYSCRLIISIDEENLDFSWQLCLIISNPNVLRFE